MTEEANVDVETSSNVATADNLKNDDVTQSWTSGPSDANPTITINVAGTDSLIETVTLLSTDNVASYTVDVVDQNGSIVSA